MSTRTQKVVLGLGLAAFLVFVVAPIAFTVLPLRTLTELRITLTASAGAVGEGQLELIDAEGTSFARQRFGRPTVRAFSYGHVQTVRVNARGCEPKTVTPEACSERFRFTDVHRYVHHGSASRYDRICEVSAVLDCIPQ